MIQNKVEDIRCYFKQALHEQQFTIDKTGAKTIELIGASFLADEPAIFGKPSNSYIQAELNWYISQSTNINDIYEDMYFVPLMPIDFVDSTEKVDEVEIEKETGVDVGAQSDNETEETTEE